MNLEKVQMLSPKSVLYFLCFDSKSIQAVATNRNSLWIGLMFVIAAGFAREYDGEYLLAEPFHVLIPIVASLIGCFCLVALLYPLALVLNKPKVGFVETFLNFLAVYWMTAPLALVYGFPFERLYDAGAATTGNLALLGVVAVWRVALMIRCVQVLYKTSIVCAVFPVMLFSDALAMLALALVPGPIFLIMGGVRLTESESLILNFRIWLNLLGYGSMLIWFFGYFAQFARKIVWDFCRVQTKSMRVSKSLWVAASFSIVFWIPFLYFTQPEQANRWKAERLLGSEDAVGFAELSKQFDRSDFPPHWDPPPRMGYGDTTPSIWRTLKALVDEDAASWARTIYREKLESEAMWGKPIISWEFNASLSDGGMSDADLEMFVEMLKELDNRAAIAENLGSSRIDWTFKDQELSESRAESFAEIRQLIPDSEE